MTDGSYGRVETAVSAQTAVLKIKHLFCVRLWCLHLEINASGAVNISSTYIYKAMVTGWGKTRAHQAHPFE